MNNRIGSADVRRIFNAMGRDTLHLVDSLYDEAVEFSDPFHRLQGRAALRDYYAAMYANVREIRFDFEGETASDDELVLYWRMTFRHARLRSGAPIAVDGCSRLRFGSSGKVVLHRDYFDAGALLYENIPLLGRIVRALRERVA